MSIAFGNRQPCDQITGDCGQDRHRCRESARVWVLITAILGSSLAFIEGSVVNLALPNLQQDLALDSADVQWVVNIYLLMLGAFILVGGAAGDRFGLTQIYLTGLGVFGLGSFGCGLVTDLTWLLVWRGIQGLGAALVIPTSLALISFHYPKDVRAKAIGTWAGASALTTAAGPVLGGWLVDIWGWPSVFLSIAPLAFLTALITFLKIPKSPTNPDDQLDLVGALMLALSLAVLTYALLNASYEPRVAVLFVAGLLGLFIFGFWENRQKTPIMPLSVFRSRVFSGANALTLALYFAFSGALYFLPFNLIQIQGYSTLAAGAAFLPITLFIGLGSVFAGETLGKLPPRPTLTVGCTITALGFAWLSIPETQTIYWQHWFPGIAVLGIGMTICVAPLTNVVMGSVADQQAGVASGINNTVSRVAGVLAIAILSGLAINSFDSRLSETLEQDFGDTVPAEYVADNAKNLAAFAVPETLPSETRLGIKTLVETSYVAVFQQLMILCAMIAALSALLAWFTLRVPQNQPSL